MSDADSNHVMARVLTERFGDRASREAARRERAAARNGDEAEARDWRRVRILLCDSIQ